MNRAVILVLLMSISGGCTCTQKEVFMKVHRKYVKKLTNWVLADNEAKKYADEKVAARNYLADLRKIDNPSLISKKLVADGFRWHAENADFVSYPWVTIARKRGDCDDFMELWGSILKGTGKIERVTVTRKNSSSAHAMLLYRRYENDILYILSNLRVLGSTTTDDWESLVRLFYGNQTDCYIKY